MTAVHTGVCVLGLSGFVVSRLVTVNNREVTKLFPFFLPPKDTLKHISVHCELPVFLFALFVCSCFFSSNGPYLLCLRAIMPQKHCPPPPTHAHTHLNVFFLCHYIILQHSLLLLEMYSDWRQVFHQRDLGDKSFTHFLRDKSQPSRQL